jgi:uncharacterized protein (TIGR02996 family)
MATELDALLEAIREAPADDLPRLALSDWCMEQSDAATQARGEFIQLRARAAALPADSPERGRMERRVVELRQQYEAEWLGGLQPLVRSWDFERGMTLIEVDSTSLRQGRLAHLAAQPGWNQVIGLKGILLNAADVNILIRSPLLLRNLTVLDLCDCEVGAGGIRLLTRASSLPWVTSLKLGYTGCGDDGAVALAESPHLTRLTVLTLYNNDISHVGANALASSPHFRKLAHLDLSRNPIQDQGARALAHSANLPALTHLALESCGIGQRGGSAFVDSTQREGLQLLDLRDNRLGKATRRELSERYGSRVLLSKR